MARRLSLQLNVIFILIVFCLFMGALASLSGAKAEAVFDFVALEQEAGTVQDTCMEYVEQRRSKGTGYLSIIIDDMGLPSYTARMNALTDAPLTMAFLPYAEGLEQMTEVSVSNGHEVILHMPMEPKSRKLRDRNMILKDEDHAISIEKMKTALSKIKHATGVNNHMGSLVTSDADKMAALLHVIKDRGLFFVDSKTIAGSVAEKTARNMGVKTIGRDVFLDHAGDKKGVAYRLRQAARTAKENGVAVAIGHPLKATYKDVKTFLKSRNHPDNITFVTISKAMMIRDCLQGEIVFEAAEIASQTEKHETWVQDILDILWTRDDIE